MSSQQDRSLTRVQRNGAEPYVDRTDIAIIGNGIAGLTAALEARRLAPDKRIVIITDQLHPTINTPALKQFAVAKLSREQLLAYPAGTERAERIHVINAHVEEIHARSKYLNLGRGRNFGYESLLIATGSSPMGLSEQTPGRGFDGVMTLHRLEDYLNLRRRLPEVQEAVVIGGGVHAIETVMGLLYWGIRVHWLIRSQTFMARMLDQTASEMVLNNVRRAGARVYTETEVKGIIGRIGVVAGVITSNQEMIPCQLVLTCTGTQPSMGLASCCTVPMQHKNGVLVDDKLRTSVRDIYAAGDVAALRNPQTGKYETRAQWYAAVLQGRIAGAMMVGHDELARQPFGVSWHATHLGELSMLTVGEPLREESHVTMLSDSSQGNYRRIAIVEDRLVGYLSLGNAQPDSLAIKRIIDEGISIRDVIKPLLRGNFDARSYLSRRHTFTAKSILTGQLPPPTPALEQRAQTRRLPETGPFEPITTQRLTGPLASPPTAPVRQTGPQQPVPVARREAEPVGVGERRQEGERPVIYEEEFSPFSGNLPPVGGGQRRGAEIAQSARNDYNGREFQSEVEEFDPFAGNLPAISGSIVESSLAPVAANSAQVGSKLWSYGERVREENARNRRDGRSRNWDR